MNRDNYISFDINNQQNLKCSFDKKIYSSTSFIKKDKTKKNNKNINELKNSYTNRKEKKYNNEDNYYFVSFDDNNISKNITFKNYIKDFGKKCPIRVNKKDMTLCMSNREKNSFSHDYSEKKSALNFVRKQHINLYSLEKENNSLSYTKINHKLIDKNSEIKNNNEVSYDIQKLKIIQIWWKRAIKINYRYNRFNIFRKCILKSILKIFYVRFISKLKYLVYYHNIKKFFFNKWFDITNKKLILRKIINYKKENKHQQKNTHILINGIKKLKYLKKSETIIKHKTINLDNIYDSIYTDTNLNTNNNSNKSLTINKTNYSSNKKVKSMIKKGKSILLNYDINTFTSIDQCHSCSASIIKTYANNKKSIKSIKMNHIPLSNRNSSSKNILKKYYHESNIKINDNNKFVSWKIPKSILPSSCFKNYIANKKKIQIRRKKNNSVFINNNNIGKLIISFTSLNNESVKKNNSINNSYIDKGQLNEFLVKYDNYKISSIHRTEGKKIFKSNLVKNTNKIINEYKKLNSYNSNPDRLKVRNNGFNNYKHLKKVFRYWFSKNNKKQILEKLIQFIINEKTKNFFIEIRKKLIKFGIIKIFNTLTLLNNFKIYQNNIKTLKLKKTILQKLKIYIIHKNRNANYNYDKILTKIHNTIGATNNMNNYIKCGNNNKNNNQIFNSNENLPNNRIKKYRTASTNIISKIIQLNKTNNSIKSNRETNKKAFITNYLNDLNRSFNRNKQRSEKLYKKNPEYSNYQISFFYNNNNKNLVEQFEKVKGDEIAQINQLKMVLNLIDQHEPLKNPNLFTCFSHWKKLISIKRRKKIPKIDEKIISFKSNHVSNFFKDNSTSSFLSSENDNKYDSSIFYRSNSISTIPEYNSKDSSDNNIINNMYISSKQTKNKTCRVKQEKINNINIHKKVYQRKILYSSNYNITQAKYNKNNNNNNPPRLVFRDISNLINQNHNGSLYHGKNDLNNDLKINFDNCFFDERFQFYNMNTYGNNDNIFNELINMKKVNKIEEKEINFVKPKKNNNLETKNNFKISITNNYFSQNNHFNY